MAASKPIRTTGHWFAFDNVALLSGGRMVFRRTHWTWRRGEQWAILGANDSGKSLLARALCDRVPVARGEIQFDLGDGDPFPTKSIALVSPETHREMVARESSFYQSRWHSGVTEGQRTVAQFLSQASVEGINPFEVGAARGDRRDFHARRRRVIRWLGLDTLVRRKLAHLSNGEQRRALLAHTLLRSVRLLILDDPFGGLDAATRRQLQGIVARLMRGGLPVLLLTSRLDELPATVTHLLLVDRHRVVAQGPRARVLRRPLARQLAAGTGSPTMKSRDQLKAGGGKRPHERTPLVELRNVTITRGGHRILDDVWWTVRAGEHWALLGPNGSGKSTLLSLLQCDNPQVYSLDVQLFGRKLQSTQGLWEVRQQIGWLSPELHLHHPPEWSCLEVVCSGFFNSVGLYHACTRRQRGAARTWLRTLGLDAAADEPLGALPLGDQRLVLLARAIVKRPRLLILDEPCQGLDLEHRRAVLAAVQHAIQYTGATLILVSHHRGELPRCVNRVLRLRAGRVIQHSRESV